MVILNKCDIVPPQVAIAWKHYLLQEFPRLHVVLFTSYPKDDSTRQLLAKGLYLTVLTAICLNIAQRHLSIISFLLTNEF